MRHGKLGGACPLRWTPDASVAGRSWNAFGVHHCRWRIFVDVSLECLSEFHYGFLAGISCCGGRIGLGWNTRFS